MSRSMRRHHKERMKKRFQKKQKENPAWGQSNPDKAAGIYSKCKCTCSCWMCGNPRKHFGKKTKQELIAELGGQNESRIINVLCKNSTTDG